MEKIKASTSRETSFCPRCGQGNLPTSIVDEEVHSYWFACGKCGVTLVVEGQKDANQMDLKLVTPR